MPRLPQDSSSLSCAADSQMVPAQWPQPPLLCPEDPHWDPLQSPRLWGLNSDLHSSHMNSAASGHGARPAGPGRLRPWRTSRQKQQSSAEMPPTGGRRGSRSVAWEGLAAWGLQRRAGAASQRTKGSWREGPDPAPTSEKSTWEWGVTRNCPSPQTTAVSGCQPLWPALQHPVLRGGT